MIADEAKYRGGCRPGLVSRSPGFPGCATTCLHRQSVTAYRDERRRQYEHAVEQAKGYDTELAEYLALHPLPTFKNWLIWHKHAERIAA